MTLFEITVSTFIFALILLALAMTQVKVQGATLSTYHQAIALQQLDLLAERLQVAGVTLIELQQAWNNLNKKILPNGRGKIIETNSAYIAKIRWGPFNSFSKCSAIFHAHIHCLQLKIPKKIHV